MDDFELIFTMLSEKVTTEISQQEKPDTFRKTKKWQKEAEALPGMARKETEKEMAMERGFPRKLFAKAGKQKTA